ncbi:MAG: SGNH/GDSL hydrolase family protein [Clostridia bacterium]|nr:SGNH/GDSL hydrolase family protein [Clostridia bacterium]
MKKRIIALVASILILTLCIILLGQLTRPKYTDNAEGALIGEYYDNAGDNDLIFVGDCEVYESFVPAMLWGRYGISSYIRGSAQQLPWQSYYILEETFEYETPKAVVFNVYSLKYGTPQNEAYNRMTLDGMKWSSLKTDAIKASMTDEESFIEYVIPLLRFHSRISELNRDDFKYMFSSPEVSHNGYLMQTGVVPMNESDSMEPLELLDYMLPERAMQYLDKMRELCEENGSELILVKAPTNSWAYWWYDEWNIQIEEYAETYDLAYYNFIPEVDEIGIDMSTDTYDGGLHLNVHGAEKLTEYFGRILTEKHGFDSKKGIDPELDKAWNERVEKYYDDKKGE